jgi:hypothetical protein
LFVYLLIIYFVIKKVGRKWQRGRRGRKGREGEGQIQEYLVDSIRELVEWHLGKSAQKYGLRQPF